MMTRKPSTRTALLKYLVALPVIGITALIFSFSLHEKDLPDRSFGAISTDTITPAPPARALPPPPPPPSLPQIGEVLYLDKMPYTVKSTDILFVNGEEIGPLTNEQIEEYSEKGYRKLEIYLREAARKKWGNHINENVYSLSSSEPTQENEIIPPNAELFQVVEKMPRFPGCEDMEGSETDKKRCAEKKMQDFLYSNLRYPEISAREGTEGQVLVSFIVEKDGSLSNIKSVRSPDEALSKEALRMVHLMNELTEKWNPGVQRGQKVRVEFMMPIQFKLNPTQRNSDSEKKLIVVGGKTINTSNNTETSKQGVEAIKSDGNHGPNGNIHVRTRSSDTDKALIVIDGVVQEREQGKKAMKDLNPNSILSISVLKDQTAIDKYGESAKDGAIEVFTKTANSNSANSLKGTVTIQKKDVTIESQNDKKADPIIILDGEIMGRSREDITNTISPSSIESIHVLKGQKAIDKYGDQGQDGVIEIISKVPQQLLEKPKLNLSQLNIYPNPVQHQLNIHLEGQEGDYRLEIVDISGISQKTKTHYNHGTSNIDIDIHELKAGMYYLIITSGNSVTTRAFVKQ